ncbi:MAG: TetR/AcrR family transcriptional regulator [Acidimicrobiales bacterium]
MSAAKTLLPSDWAVAALEAIATDGVDKLSIERLAKQLGVTKGSFYWHFADRAALITAATEEWERQATDEVISALSEIADPRQRLRSLFEVSFGDDALGPIDTALASRADDPLLGEIVRRVTAKRLASLESIFAEIGFTPTIARRQARIAYAAYLGHFQMASALADDDNILGGGRSAYLDQMVHTLARESTSR